MPYSNDVAKTDLHIQHYVQQTKTTSKQVVKVICQKAASPPHIDSSIVFVRLRQCAPHGISIASAVSVQLAAESPYTSQWAVSLSLKIAHCHG